MVKTAEIMIEIPDDVIETHIQKKIAKIEKELEKALKREERAKKKIKEMEYEVQIAKEATQKFHNVIEDLRWHEQYVSLFIGDYA